MQLNNFVYSSAEEVVQAAFSIMEASMKYEQSFLSPLAAKNYFRLRLGLSEREIFCVMFLNNQHQLIATDDLFFGTIDGATVYPREVVKAALKHNAAAVMFAHNHPSGTALPSEADKQITKRLVEALALVDVRVLDHIIVTAQTESSFAELGLI